MLSGLFLGGYFFSQSYARQFKEDIRLLVEFGSDASETDHRNVLEALQQEPGVVGESVEFVSKDAALAEMHTEMESELLFEDMENPFRDMVQFSVDAGHFNAAYIDSLSRRLQQRFPVSEVYHPRDLFGDVFTLLAQIRIYAVIFIVIALVITGTLIHHIMRLNVMAQRRQIRTMELVGAEKGFIRKPFLRRGLQMAALAWVLSLVAGAALWYLVLGRAVFFDFVTAPATLLGALLLLGLALVICTFSTWIAVGKSIGRSAMNTA